MGVREMELDSEGGGSARLETKAGEGEAAVAILVWGEPNRLKFELVLNLRR